MLMPAAKNQSAMKTLAAVATPVAGVGPPIQRPIRRQSASSTRPPAMTLSACIEWLHSAPQHRAELFRDLGRSRRWQNRGRVAEEARDCDRSVPIEPDEPITVLRKCLHAGKSLLELIERGLLDPHVHRLVRAAPRALGDPNP